MLTYEKCEVYVGLENLPNVLRAHHDHCISEIGLVHSRDGFFAWDGWAKQCHLRQGLHLLPPSPFTRSDVRRQAARTVARFPFEDRRAIDTFHEIRKWVVYVHFHEVRPNSTNAFHAFVRNPTTFLGAKLLYLTLLHLAYFDTCYYITML